MPVQLIGDLLASELAHMQPYIRFCSCQLNAAALLQSKMLNQPEFKDFLKVGESEYKEKNLTVDEFKRKFCKCLSSVEQKIATNYRCKGMPLSSFLLKPMQRITRYPLIIKNVG